MIDKSNDKKFISELETHFNKAVLKDRLDDYIPNCLNIYFRAPFEYIISVYCKNLANKNILDYCCGTGINSIIFSKAGAIIKGIDISSDSVEIAKKKFKKHNLTKYEFYKMNAHYLNFEDKSFDYVICYKSLLYLNLEKSFKEIYRVLNDDGKIIILEDIGDNFVFNYYRFLKHIFKSKKFASELNKIKLKDFDIASKYFISENTKFFNFFTVFGKFIGDKLKIKISHKFLKYLDFFLLNRLGFNFLSFTVVKVFKKKLH
jgi:SAM-dependent methyltransferase